MHKFCLWLIAAYKWSIVAPKRVSSLSLWGHPSRIWTQESLSPHGSREPFYNLSSQGLSPPGSRELEGMVGDSSGRTLPPKAKLFIATCSSCRNSQRWLPKVAIVLHPASATTFLYRSRDPAAWYCTRHQMLCKQIISCICRENTRKLRRGKAEASWKGKKIS